MTMEGRFQRSGMEECPMCRWLEKQVIRWREEFIVQADELAEMNASQLSESARERLEGLQKAWNDVRSARTSHRSTYHPIVAQEDDLPW